MDRHPLLPDRRHPAVCLLTVLLIGLLTSPLSAGLYQDRSRFLRNIKWVHLEILNLEKSDPQLSAAIRSTLKQKIQSLFRAKGIMVSLTEDREKVLNINHLRVKIHKIVLERTVYLSAVEIVEKQAIPGKSPIDPMQPLRYTDVADRLESVVPAIIRRVRQMVDWYL